MGDAKTFYERYWADEHIKVNAFDEHPEEWTQENFDHHMAFFSPYVKGGLLDFGCGDGQFLNLIAKQCDSVHGVDISETALEKAQAQYPALDFKLMPEDGKLPYADGFFDTITATDVLEHILDLETLLEEMNRVLKPGGHLLLATSEITRTKMVLISLKFLDDYFYPASPHIRYFTRKNLADILKRKGFESVGYRKNRTYFGFIPHGQMVAAKKIPS